MRRPLWQNPQLEATNSRASWPELDAEALKAFHSSLPGYRVTPLVGLPDVAEGLGVKAVFVKDESCRAGLPSFKILGASWATFKALCQRFQVPTSTKLDDLKRLSQDQRIELYAATDGNHGRAVAYMAQSLGITAHIFVPRTLDGYTKDKLKATGFTVNQDNDDYDAAVAKAYAESQKNTNGLLIQDTAFKGYEELPKYIVEGYTTMLREVDEQLATQGLVCSVMLTPVGVGSLAHAVTLYGKTVDAARTIVAVEPDTAACLYKSLQAGELTSIRTSYTIMTGMDCGTPSTTAWPSLKKYLHTSLTVSDYEAHVAVGDLDKHSIQAGPCGAGILAGLRCLAGSSDNGVLNEDSVVVLLCTEGQRPYTTPNDVTLDDVVTLTQNLVQIDSSNPTLSASGVGEVQIANFVAAWFEHRGIEQSRVESTRGRPSIIGRVKGSGGGKSIMLNGHLDTVSHDAYEGNPLSGELQQRNEREVIVGRGSQDMKSGLAAAMTALAYAANSTHLRGDVIVVAAADEEDASIGTADVLAAGWTADAGVVTEPTDLKLGAGHKGFVWIEIDILGVAAHGSRPADGVDAIMNASYFLDALRQYSESLPIDDRLGQASLHCGKISGGVETSSYPAICTVTVEFRTIPAQSPESIAGDIAHILTKLKASVPHFKAGSPRIVMSQAPYKLDLGCAFAKLVQKVAARAGGIKSEFTSLSFWCDAALMAEAGIPSIVLGPIGAGLHSKDEWVDVASLHKTEAYIKEIIDEFCS